MIYGLTGLTMEVFWTGLGSFFAGDFGLTGHTYIWMFFIYGLAVFLEPVHDRIREKSVIVRGLVWVILIYAIEFASGFILQTLIGYCPWDYRMVTKYTFWGFIRLDYVPVWFVVGMIFERYHDFLDIKIIIK